MHLRRFSTMSIRPINISTSAWDKMTHILEKSNEYAFVFFATGGGCNGFNYKLESIGEKKFDNLTAEEPSPIIVTNSNTQVIIEPMSEMLLLGTTIDFIEEDYNEKDFATSCGCGISFSPK